MKRVGIKWTKKILRQAMHFRKPLPKIKDAMADRLYLSAIIWSVWKACAQRISTGHAGIMSPHIIAVKYLAF